MTINSISLCRPDDLGNGDDITYKLRMQDKAYPDSHKSFAETATKVMKVLKVPYLIASAKTNEQENEHFYDGLHAITHFTEAVHSNRRLKEETSKLHYYVITELEPQNPHTENSTQTHYIGSHEQISDVRNSQSLLNLLIYTYRATPSAEDFFLAGLKFDKGEGCKQNHSLARHYFELAALRGHEESQYRIAWMFLLGGRGDKCQKKAKTYLKMFLANESATPKNNTNVSKENCEREERISSCALALAKLYRKEKKWDKAIEYYRKAGEMDTDAKYECAQMLMEGRVPNTDERRALVIQLLREVANHDDEKNNFGSASFIKVEAQFQLAHLLNRYIRHIPPISKQSWTTTREQLLSASLDWTPVSRAWKEAKENYEKASSHGNVDAKFELAMLLTRPLERHELDQTRIKQLLIEAAEKGHPHAQLEMFKARHPLRGIRLSHSDERNEIKEKLPQEYLKLSADQNLPEAQYEWARWLENEGRDAQHEEKKGDRICDLITAISYYEKAIETWTKRAVQLNAVRTTQVYLDNLTLPLSDYGDSFKAALQKQIELDIHSAVNYSANKGGQPCISIKIEADKKVFECEIEGTLESKDMEEILQSMIDSGACKMALFEMHEDKWRERQKFSDSEQEVFYSEKDLSTPQAEGGLERLGKIASSSNDTIPQNLRNQAIGILAQYLKTCRDERLLKQTIQILQSVTLKGLSAENCEIMVSSLNEFLSEGATTNSLKKETVEALKIICGANIPAERRIDIIIHLTSFLGKDEYISEDIINALTFLATGRLGPENYETVVLKLMDVMLTGRKVVDPIAEALGKIAYDDRDGPMGVAIVKRIKDHLITFAREYDQPTCGFIQWHNKSGPRKALRKLGHNYGQKKFVEDLVTGIKFAIDLAQKVKP